MPSPEANRAAPCPWCDGPINGWVSTDDPEDPQWAVACEAPGCGATGPWRDTHNDANLAWNKVAGPPAEKGPRASPPAEPISARQVFWSARTLRIVTVDTDGADSTEDILGVDRDRCIFAYGEWGDLIVRLLNDHLAKEGEQT